MHSSPIATIVLIAWVPFTIILFSILPHRRAVIVAFLIAWLFLPITVLSLPGFPDYNKISATCIGVFLATIILDPNRLTHFKPKLIDLPMIVLCFCPAASSLSNGMPPYDALSAAFYSTVKWGMPYFIGRIYFNDLEGMKELVIGVFIGGIIYIPFCLYEIRMSPQLHTMVYGFHQHSFEQTKRSGGGWRPTVFMQHGLMVSMWMSMCSVSGLWLWRHKVLKRLYGIPVSLILMILVTTSILCKSGGALILMCFGICILLLTNKYTTNLTYVAVSILIVIYLLFRAPGLWDGDEIISICRTLMGSDRAGSLEYRFRMEEIFSAHTRSRIILGWGGWGRNSPSGVKTIPDSLWIVIFSKYGSVGLSALITTFLLPVIMLRKRIHPGQWSHPFVAPTVCATAIVLLYTIDNLSNAMYNPIYILMIGGLAGIQTTRMTPGILMPHKIQQKKTDRDKTKV